MYITSLIYPVAAMVFLTFSMLSLMLYYRIKAVRMRQLSPRYFKLNKGENVPDHLVAITQNYENLLEIPILFYIVCIIAIILNQSAEYFMLHAWVYVILRIFHSIIHTTYNHIVHRLLVFLLSCLVLVSMWIKVVLITV